jgi:hypothetical protein
MNVTADKRSLLILSLTAVVCSRLMFVFFTDPEGPNLLVVIVAAALIYGASLLMYTGMLSLGRAYITEVSLTARDRLSLKIGFQILATGMLYVGLHIL